MYASQEDLVKLFEGLPCRTPEMEAVRDWLLEQMKGVPTPKLEGIFAHHGFPSSVRLLYKENQLFFNIKDLMAMLSIRCRQITEQAKKLHFADFNLSSPEQLRAGFASITDKFASLLRVVAKYDVLRN
jgi:hypothetical protein